MCSWRNLWCAMLLSKTPLTLEDWPVLNTVLGLQMPREPSPRLLQSVLAVGQPWLSPCVSIYLLSNCCLSVPVCAHVCTQPFFCKCNQIFLLCSWFCLIMTSFLHTVISVWVKTCYAPREQSFLHSSRLFLLFQLNRISAITPLGFSLISHSRELKLTKLAVLLNALTQQCTSWYLSWDPGFKPWAST